MKYPAEIALGYEDVYLVPNKCEVIGRATVNTSWKFPNRNLSFNLPIIPANMRSVVDYRTYEKYAEYGIMPILHRFEVDAVSFLTGVSTSWKAISIGVNESDFDQIRLINKLTAFKRPTLICIDIAHGHSETVKRMISFIKVMLPETIVIAGNVTTPEAVTDLQNWGADMIKVGIGGGYVCSTKNKTGFHIPMFTAIQQCSEVANVPIIADGGIKENGDITKALVAGADLVMIGGLFAACTDSPAVIIDGKKEYYGSASAKNKGYNRNVEGFAVHLTPTMTIEDKIAEITQDLQSAISYAGGNDLSALDFSKVKYNIVK